MGESQRFMLTQKVKPFMTARHDILEKNKIQDREQISGCQDLRVMRSAAIKGYHKEVLGLLRLLRILTLVMVTQTNLYL